MRRKLTYDPQRDYYAILGVDATATPEQVRLAYRRCVREVHPDLNPQRADWATEQIQVINEAYAVLRQPARRREYDQLRWPHVPSQPAGSPTGYRSPFRAPYYDHSRPWWEQVAEQAPRAYPFTSDARSHPQRRRAATDPYWLAVSVWLKRHGLGRLQPTWLTLVGLWRGPYAGLLMFLGFVLAINVAVIIYAFMTPHAWDDLNALFSPQGAAVADGTPTATPAATSDQLYTSCLEPGVQITQPVRGDVVGDQFSIYGTVEHPDMWSYRIEVGYIGRMFNLAVVPSMWDIVRSAPRNQSIPEPPIVNDLLTETPVDLEGRPTGYYAIRLSVILPDESTLMPCDVVVRR